jgi:hypothetical protein
MLWLMPADLRRQRIGMMFIGIDSSAGAARSAAAGTRRTDGPRLVHSRQRSGGKGAKGGNLESLGNTGLADDGAKRRKPGETGGNPFWGPYSGAKVFLRAGIGGLPVGDWQNACGNCGNPHDEPHQGFASALGNLGNLANPHSAASRRTSGAALAGEACPDGCNNERRKGRKGRKPIFGPL